MFADTLPSYNVDFTYESSANHARTTVDHFVVAEQLANRVTGVFCDLSVHNLSDHNALTLVLNVQVTAAADASRGHQAEQPVRKRKPLWHKASPEDLARYRAVLDEYLTSRISLPQDALSCTDVHCTIHSTALQAHYKSLVDACLFASSECIPHSSPFNTRQRQVVPGWNAYIRPLKEDAIFWHNIWKECGRPAQGPVASIRRSTRSRYHSTLKRVKKQEEALRFAAMGERYLHDQKAEFWTEVEEEQVY